MKGDIGFPGIGLQGWSGQKVNWFNMTYFLLSMLFAFYFTP